ncbi:MAG: dTDP-4-dehydrorhamnose 3,5-epimerase family protein, partial [Hyphomicrobiales bacterium]
MDIQSLNIPDVKLLTPKRFGDHRGFLEETYNREQFFSAGIDTTFVQDNHSMSSEIGTVRGLH